MIGNDVLRLLRRLRHRIGDRAGQTANDVATIWLAVESRRTGRTGAHFGKMRRPVLLLLDQLFGIEFALRFLRLLGFLALIAGAAAVAERWRDL